MTSAEPANTMNASIPHPPSAPADLKRKRSPSHEHLHAAPAPIPKQPKTSNHLQINYLARQCETDLPLITNDDTLPNILSLLSDYQGVLDRHESMACNLGARPLGPILIKRFERLFDGPPRVLKSHGKDGISVSWLDVVEFARNKPEQFQLGQMSEGVRVCQFYTKQCRVQISEEDFVLISSGIPQKMIPPQPIIEDEEKELGTLDILEKNLGQICQLADQVAARTRQLNHRLKGRKQAILDRRATASPAPPIRPASPSNVALMSTSQASVAHAQASAPSPGSFVAVNSRSHGENGASSSTRHELMSKFQTLSERKASVPMNGMVDNGRASVGPHSHSHSSTPVSSASKPPPKPIELGQPSMLPRPQHMPDSELHHVLHSPVPIPNTPSNLLPATSQRTQQSHEKDDGGPFKVAMVQRMESLLKGERIMPPCDRCRRLHMDCLKNLTACMGCTKKHAKCSWKEVREGELRDGTFSYPTSGASAIHSESEENDGLAHADRASTSSPTGGASPVGAAASVPPAHPPPSAAPLPIHQQQAPSFPPEPNATTAHRNSPPHRELERDRSVDVKAQLQEAAKSGLAAHANGRLGGMHEGNMHDEAKPADFPPLVA